MAIRKPGTRLLTGFKELDRKLEKLTIRAANKIARPPMVKALRLVVKSMKAAVPSPYKEAKRAIGYAADRKGGKKKDQLRYKAGASVGKASKAEPKKHAKGTGVGLGGANIHWFLLGTQGRATSGPDKLGRPAHATGTMQPILQDAVKKGFNNVASQAMGIIKQGVRAGLAEAAK